MKKKCNLLGDKSYIYLSAFLRKTLAEEPFFYCVFIAVIKTIIGGVDRKRGLMCGHFSEVEIMKKLLVVINIR
jgi:hypothetical protein